MKPFNLIIFYLTIILLISCVETSKEKLTDREIIHVRQKYIDSIEITQLIRQAYELHESNNLKDFPFQFHKVKKPIIIGIDWKKYQENIVIFKKNNFLSIDFLKRHKEIARNIDSSIKKADIKWRNITDGIPVWETGADDWCGCQDSPDNYWKQLIVDSLTIKDNSADFIWSWDKTFSHTYKVNAKKEGGKWKINSLDGFKYFYIVKDYDKMMKD